MKTRYLLVSVVVLFIAVPTFVWRYISYEVSKEVVPSGLSDYQFSVEEGDTTMDVIDGLGKWGVSLNPLMVRVYLRLNPELVGDIHVGEYWLKPGQNIIQVLNSLQGGHEEQQRLTFIEGWRREEYAYYLLQEIGEDFAKEFYEISEGMEGHLFPDTYFVDEKTTPEMLRDRMIDNYEKKISYLVAKPDLIENGLTIDDVIIFASILEREIQEPTDQVIVAGILVKRYMSGWPLEADATVQYAVASDEFDEYRSQWNAVKEGAIDWWPKTISQEDLKLDSEYNTRLNLGLPPTPISNPGISSIEAVVSPLMSNYWFYISDAQGITRFSSTLAEHNQNIQQFGLAQ